MLRELRAASRASYSADAGLFLRSSQTCAHGGLRVHNSSNSLTFNRTASGRFRLNTILFLCVFLFNFGLLHLLNVVSDQRTDQGDNTVEPSLTGSAAGSACTTAIERRCSQKVTARYEPVEKMRLKAPEA